MSLNIDKKKGVKLKTSKKNGALIFAILIVIESVFTFFLYLSLAGKIFAPPKAESAAGVPELISYQGRLTDTSGNPLGGAGTVYCFRYYIYDSATTGNQIWPAGTATNSTTTVADGVFSDQIGRMDSLATQDFMSTSSLYLQVQVNTTTSTCAGSWENLTPRQQITSNAWSQTAQNIYGDIIRTNVARKAQIGTGLGSSSSTITMLSLDVNNTSGDENIGGTCSNNGSLWYDSTFTRALVCENNVIQTISNSSTTIAGIKENSTSTVISSGVANFSAQANITINQTGNTLGFSVAAPGGGAGVTLSRYPNMPWGMWTTAAASLYSGSTSANGASTHSTMSYYVQPMDLHDAVAFSKIQLIQSMATSAGTGSATLRKYMGIYTMNNGTLSLSSSWLAGYLRSQNSVTAQTMSVWTGSASNSVGSFQGNSSAQIAAARLFPQGQGALTLSAGQYYVIHGQQMITSGVNFINQSWGVGANSSYVQIGNNSSASSMWAPMVGAFSSTSSTNAAGANQWLMPSSVNSTAISYTNAASHFRDIIIMLRNN